MFTISKPSRHLTKRSITFATSSTLHNRVKTIRSAIFLLFSILKSILYIVEIYLYLTFSELRTIQLPPKKFSPDDGFSVSHHGDRNYFSLMNKSNIPDAVIFHRRALTAISNASSQVIVTVSALWKRKIPGSIIAKCF
jgi:hypothetical protein